MRKTALVLSGGGFRGAFQLGVLSYLKKNWNIIDPQSDKMKFNIISGVSVGALNGLLLACDKFNELEELWKQVELNGEKEIYFSDFLEQKIVSGRPEIKLNLGSLVDELFASVENIHLGGAEKLQLLFSKKHRKNFVHKLKKEIEQTALNKIKSFKSLADNSPLQDKLHRLAKIESIKDGVFIIGFVSLNNGKYYSLKHTDFITDADFAEGVLASTTMPMIWPPVNSVNTIHGRLSNLVDGGVRVISPLEDVVRELKNQDDAEEYLLIIINCSSGSVDIENYDNKNIGQIALRTMYEITMSEIFNNDIQHYLSINHIISQVRNSNPEIELFALDAANSKESRVLKSYKTILIQPGPKVLGDSLIATKDLIQLRVAHGVQKAKLALDAYKASNGELDLIVA